MIKDHSWQDSSSYVGLNMQTGHLQISAAIYKCTIYLAPRINFKVKKDLLIYLEPVTVAIFVNKVVYAIRYRNLFVS